MSESAGGAIVPHTNNSGSHPPVSALSGPAVKTFAGSGGLIRSLGDVQRLAQIYAQSSFFADSKQVAQAAVKILYGLDLGFSPTASMIGIYIVKGRVTLSANAMAAIVMRSRLHRYRIKEISSLKCHILFQCRDSADKPWEHLGDSTFTIEDAKAASLSSGGTYKAYPRNMLFARAMSNGAKWFCPELFLGLTPYLPEEVEPGLAPTDSGEYALPSVNVEVVPTPMASLSPGVEAVLREQLPDLIKQTGTDLAKLLDYYKADSLNDLAGPELLTCFELLTKRLASTSSKVIINSEEEQQHEDDMQSPVPVIHEVSSDS